jgi:hypothetical protein
VAAASTSNSWIGILIFLLLVLLAVGLCVMLVVRHRRKQSREPFSMYFRNNAFGRSRLNTTNGEEELRDVCVSGALSPPGSANKSADGSLTELHNPGLTPNFLIAGSREMRRTSVASSAGDPKAGNNSLGDPLGANEGQYRYTSDPAMAASRAGEAVIATPMNARHKKMGKTFTLDSRQSDDSYGKLS